MEQHSDDVFCCCRIRNQETLIPRFCHEDTVIDSNDSTLAHLQGELALSPWMAGFEFNWPRLVIQGERPLQWDPRPLDVNIHRKVEELGITVSHFVLGQEEPDELP